MSLNPRQFQQLDLGIAVPTSEPSPGPHGPAMTKQPADRRTGETDDRGRPVRRPLHSWEKHEHHDQTTMLMPTERIINEVHKIDSDRYNLNLLHRDGPGTDPADEWDDVRREKEVSPHLADGVRNRDPIPPIRIQHEGDALYRERMELWNGHHRLKAYEDAGHTEIPVWESWDRKEKDPSGGGYRGGLPA